MNVDAVVIGAGVIGSAIALELQRGGRQVLVVDKGAAVGGGSTSASSSVIRFTYSTIDGVTAAWEAMHQWADWANHLGASDGPLCQFHRIGMLHIGAPDEDFSNIRSNFERIGVPYEMLDDDAIATRFPAIDIGSFHPPRLPSDPDFFRPANGSIVALYQPDAGFIDDPQLAAVNLMDAARRHGAVVRLRTTVTSIIRSEDRVGGVELDGSEIIEAPVVINAAGPWSSQLNELAGVLDDMQIATRPMRQTVAASAAPSTFGVDHGGTVVADGDLGAYWRPQPGGSFLIGGIEAACDPLEWVDEPDDDSLLPDPAMFEALVYRAARRLPDLAIPHRPSGLSSHYDVSDDWVPIYDRSSLDGFYLAIGTSGNQFKNAPIVGEMLAALVTACEAGHDHDRDPVKVPCRHTGLTLDLAQFSRNRERAATGNNVWG